MKKDKIPHSIRNKINHHEGSILFIFCILAVLMLFFITGCTLKEVASPIASYFAREASMEEEELSPEKRVLSSRIKDSSGTPLSDDQGEPLTVLAVYELATGGEYRINQRGELETYPLGEIVTYAPGTVVTDANGNPETYAGGETVTNVLGFEEKAENGEPVTRAAGETVTHGADDIVYDDNGEPVRYSGEPQTYAAGEIQYNTNGEEVTYPVAIQVDLNGEAMTNESGEVLLGAIEIVTNESGDPFVDENGEAATRQLDPAEPVKLVDQPLEEGEYYINSMTSPYLFFSVVQGSEDSAQNQSLQLELPGESLPGFDMRIDLEGYAIFVMQGTNLALTYDKDLKDGAAITLREMEKTPYSQYKYWDDPKFTVSEDQKWILKENGDGVFTICSALDDSYVATVSQQEGNQTPKLIMQSDEGSEQQLFRFVEGAPTIQRYIEEGVYYIRNGLTNWMLLSLGDGNYTDGRELYIYFSDQGDGQKMHIYYDEYGYATIEHADSGMVLSVSGAKAQDNQPIIQAPADGGLWQKWILEPNPEGDEGYFIRSALDPTRVMNLRDGVARNETPVQLYQGYDNYAQYWFFEEEGIPAGNQFESMEAYAQNFNSQTEYLILVNSTTNHVGIYQGEQGNWTNLYYWNCVTGKSTTPTVKGEFTINKKLPSFDGNTDSPTWYTVYYASGFYPFYYFHSIIYYQGTKDIMDATMGYNASHGCVRLYIENAQWIYENIPLDTRVISY